MLLDFYFPYNYRNGWFDTIQYQINDAVHVPEDPPTGTEHLYRAIAPSINQNPSVSGNNFWENTSFTYATALWTSGTTYNIHNIVDSTNGPPDGYAGAFWAPTEPRSSLDYSTRDPGLTEYPWVRVTSSRSTLISNIRDLIQVGLSSDDLPDDIVLRTSFFGAAETHILNRLGLTTAAYTEKLATDPAFRQRITVAVERRTAAFLIPSLPQVVEESILNQRWRYLEVDWQEKISLLLRLSDEAIVDDLVSVQGAVYGVAQRYVGF